MWSCVLVSLCLCLPCLAMAHEDPNPSPIIGIFSAPILDSNMSQQICGAASCEVIPASYFKFIEAAGGRAMPVSYYSSDEEIDHLASSLNGVLFPGGEAPLPRAAERLLNRSLEMHKTGAPLPVWGTCLGFEWLLNFTAPGSLQQGFDSNNLSLPLNLSEDALNSRLLGLAPKNIVQSLTQHKTTFNMHVKGASPSQWTRFPALEQTFHVLSTNVDRQGVPFVSTIEGKNGLPWYGAQWHPEKNAFEHGQTADGRPFASIPHTRWAVAVEQYVANFFVEEARKNTQRFSDPAEEYRRFTAGSTISLSLRPYFEEAYLLRYDNSHGAAPVMLV
eukprot:gnl/TRDRNA2_/TRDRNA2_86016_c0_seq1.p1 gnl/TRDRNA2_/TRDRNA2_86016_c0~~gnl/TRDRNA2_/TRDRNA2_86016_c0_seq1.p1  ORF type:complete len:332 (+),score=37.72 gnl/TRDRNA2_/TRDRNA2_86016_c0_seq1:51-1046(+)